ncbi:type I restriction enzyme, S subunit [Pseudarcicella hirudinis]|uniref:Type I restriction enzyme, S subunit n=3 Tax=Pseudarcicella hirudinis TaxID=1079859 RepID=A0A1I5Y5V4_9BACT|nr:type I restriction enzyme, S subunit [Pseudarcicella hirudinis]
MENEKLKVGNVPNLRFKGFEEEWESKKLGEVATVSSGGTPNRAIASYWNGSIPWVSTGLINFNFINKVDEYITEEGLDNSSAKLFSQGTLLIAMYGQGKTRGKVAMLNIEATTNQACGAITTNKNILNPLFAFQNLTKRYDEIRDLSNQGGQENLSAGIIKGIEINFPKIPEQQKIASFLSLIDERITTQNKIIGELNVLKTTVAKKIFSQQLRFKDDVGNDFQEWECKNLQDVCTIIGGGTPETNKIEYWNGDIQWFTPTEIKSNFVSKSERTISISGLKNSSAKLLPKGTILLTTRATIGEVAISLEECATNQGFQSLVVKKNYNNVFLFNWLKVNKYELEKRVNGSTFPEISKSEIEKIEIVTPCLEEQTKIANFLSSIDQKIQTEKQILELLEKQKKYLLQQMFI